MEWVGATVRVLHAPLDVPLDAEWHLSDGATTLAVVHPLGAMAAGEALLVPLPSDLEAVGLGPQVNAQLVLTALDASGLPIVSAPVSQVRLEAAGGRVTVAEPLAIDLELLAGADGVPDALVGHTATQIAVAPAVARSLSALPPLDLSDKAIDVPGHVVFEANEDLAPGEVAP